MLGFYGTSGEMRLMVLRIGLEIEDWFPLSECSTLLTAFNDLCYRAVMQFDELFFGSIAKSLLWCHFRLTKYEFDGDIDAIFEMFKTNDR